MIENIDKFDTNISKKQFISEYMNNLSTIIEKHCFIMGLFDHIPTKKKKNKIIESVLISALISELSPDEMLDFVNDVENDKVIDISFFKKGGNIYQFTNPRWHKFLMELWTKTPLGTPNSASGEGEFMFVFSSKHIVKPTKGDLLVNGKLYELKAEDVRVSSNITGKQFREMTVNLCEKYGLIPNSANRTNLKAVELEKIAHQEHWSRELNKLTFENKKNFISDYLKCIDSYDHNVDDLFIDGVLNFNELIKYIVKILYRSMVNRGGFDEFVILGDGTDVKIFNTDLTTFNESIDNGTILPKNDYFRINQDFYIGWYIS
jgi:hypothetical protein